MKNFFRASVLGLGALALSTAALHASTFKSESVSIPFAFKVSKRQFPAGEYRVEQNNGSVVATIISVKTGERVNILRSDFIRDHGRVRLVFEGNDGGVYSLRKVQ